MRKELNYNELYNEIQEKLKAEQTMILATCANNKVMARTICHINDGVTIMFSTGDNSEKIEQMKKNPNIALAVGNLRIEAVAEIIGNADDYQFFLEEYPKKFPHLGGLYGSDYFLVIMNPMKISLYKYIDGACEDVLEVDTKTAYRILYDK